MGGCTPPDPEGCMPTKPMQSDRGYAVVNPQEGGSPMFGTHTYTLTDNSMWLQEGQRQRLWAKTGHFNS